MATRAYRRDSKGRFAGSGGGGGTFITYGKAGGFASSALRSRTNGQTASTSKSLGATAGAKGRPSRVARVLRSPAARRARTRVTTGAGVIAVGVAARAIQSRKVNRGLSQISAYSGNRTGMRTKLAKGGRSPNRTWAVGTSYI